MTLLAFLCTLGAAQEPPEPQWVHHFTVYEENDYFAHVSKSDKHYTQGLRLEYRFQAPGEEGEPLFTLREFYDDDDGKLSIENGFTIGHEMYTPEDITNPLPQPDDRPYVAWLYLGLITTVGDAENQWRDTWEIDVGTVGPNALGDEIQSGWHDIIGQDNPTWAGQIKNEIGVIGAWKRQWLHHAFGTKGADWGVRSMTSLGIRLGTVKTDAAVGSTFLFGYHVPADFEVGRGMTATKGGQSLRLYGFAGVEGRVTPWDLFLDGGVFREGPSISRKYLVGDFSAGVVLRLWERFGLSYGQVFRTGEISTDPRYHNFGSIILSYSVSF